jgi:hypothetical protein
MHLTLLPKGTGKKPRPYFTRYSYVYKLHLVCRELADGREKIFKEYKTERGAKNCAYWKNSDLRMKGAI